HRVPLLRAPRTAPVLRTRADRLRCAPRAERALRGEPLRRALASAVACARGPRHPGCRSLRDDGRSGLARRHRRSVPPPLSRVPRGRGPDAADPDARRPRRTMNDDAMEASSAMVTVGIEAMNVFGGSAFVDVRALAEHRGLDLARFENLMMKHK